MLECGLNQCFDSVKALNFNSSAKLVRKEDIPLNSVIVKSLLWTWHKVHYVIIVLPLDKTVDIKKLAIYLQLSGPRHVRLASTELVYSVTGQKVGNVSPIGHKQTIRTIIDSSLIQDNDLDTICYGGAGDEQHELAISIQELLKFSHIEVADISTSANTTVTNTTAAKFNTEHFITIDPSFDNYRLIKQKDNNSIEHLTNNDKLVNINTIAVTNINKNTLTTTAGTTTTTPTTTTKPLTQQPKLTTPTIRMETDINNIAKTIRNLAIDKNATDQLKTLLYNLTTTTIYTTIDIQNIINLGTTSSGKTALHLASWKGSLQTVLLLLQYGADVNQYSFGTGNYGKTAIFYAITQCRNDIVEILLEYNANVKIINNKGQTPYSLALTHCNLSTTNLIKTLEKQQNNQNWLNFYTKEYIWELNTCFGDLDIRFHYQTSEKSTMQCENMILSHTTVVKNNENVSKNDDFLPSINPTTIYSRKQHFLSYNTNKHKNDDIFMFLLNRESAEDKIDECSMESAQDKDLDINTIILHCSSSSSSSSNSSSKGSIANNTNNFSSNTPTTNTHYTYTIDVITGYIDSIHLPNTTTTTSGVEFLNSNTSTEPFLILTPLYNTYWNIKYPEYQDNDTILSSTERDTDKQHPCRVNKVKLFIHNTDLNTILMQENNILQCGMIVSASGKVVVTSARMDYIEELVVSSHRIAVFPTLQQQQQPTEYSSEVHISTSDTDNISMCKDSIDITDTTKMSTSNYHNTVATSNNTCTTAATTTTTPTTSTSTTTTPYFTLADLLCRLPPIVRTMPKIHLVDSIQSLALFEECMHTLVSAAEVAQEQQLPQPQQLQQQQECPPLAQYIHCIAIDCEWRPTTSTNCSSNNRGSGSGIVTSSTTGTTNTSNSTYTTDATTTPTPSHDAHLTNTKQKHEYPVEIIQIATTTDIFIIDMQTLLRNNNNEKERIQIENKLNSCLQRVFLCKALLKLGYQIISDFERLFASYPTITALSSVSRIVDVYTLTLTVLPEIVKNSSSSYSSSTSTLNYKNLSLSTLCSIVHRLSGGKGLIMDKSQQCSDWHIRPLTTAQVNYAALDAAVLQYIFYFYIHSYYSYYNNSDADKMNTILDSYYDLTLSVQLPSAISTLPPPHNKNNTITTTNTVVKYKYILNTHIQTKQTYSKHYHTIHHTHNTNNKHHHHNTTNTTTNTKSHTSYYKISNTVTAFIQQYCSISEIQRLSLQYKAEELQFVGEYISYNKHDCVDFISAVLYQSSSDSNSSGSNSSSNSSSNSNISSNNNNNSSSSGSNSSSNSSNSNISSNNNNNNNNNSSSGSSNNANTINSTTTATTTTTAAIKPSKPTIKPNQSLFLLNDTNLILFINTHKTTTTTILKTPKRELFHFLHNKKYLHYLLNINEIKQKNNNNTIKIRYLLLQYLYNTNIKIKPTLNIWVFLKYSNKPYVFLGNVDILYMGKIKNSEYIELYFKLLQYNDVVYYNNIE